MGGVKMLLAVVVAGAFAVAGTVPANADGGPEDPPCTVSILGGCVGETVPPYPEYPYPMPAPEAEPKPDKPPRKPRPQLVYEDHRPCVAKVEYQSVSSTLTRSQVATRWETQVAGHVDVPTLGRVDVYKRCGYRLSRAWYGIVYRDGTVYASAAWKSHT